MALTATRLVRDVERLNNEIKGLEESLLQTGTIKTADDVQKELDDLAAEM